MTIMDAVGSIGDRFGAVVVAAVVVGIPLGAVIVVVMARLRMHRGWSRGWAWRSAVAEVGMVVGTVPWVWMIMTPTAGTGGVRLVPFRDLAGVLAGDDVVVQLIGNLLVFAALGAFLPVRFRLGRPAAVVPIVAGIAAALSALLETLQFALALGRVSSIDDVILNAAGAAIAAALSIRWWRSRRGPRSPRTTGALPGVAGRRPMA